MTLAEFLLARIAEDEEVAQHWAKGLWLVGNAFHRRYTPSRAVAECEAKRQIVESAEAIRGHDKTYAERLKHGDEEDATYVIAGDILRHLAAVYAGHPDYREEWRP